MKYVVVPHWQSFVTWCRDQGINPNDKHTVVMCTNGYGMDRCRGRRFDPMYDKVVYYGPWEQGKDAQYIQELLCTIGAPCGV